MMLVLSLLLLFAFFYPYHAMWLCAIGMCLL